MGKREGTGSSVANENENSETREQKKVAALTLSNCLLAKSSSCPTGKRSITGREMVFIDDSIISAPYCN